MYGNMSVDLRLDICKETFIQEAVKELNIYQWCHCKALFQMSGGEDGVKIFCLPMLLISERDCTGTNRSILLCYCQSYIILTKMQIEY